MLTYLVFRAVCGEGHIASPMPQGGKYCSDPCFLMHSHWLHTADRTSFDVRLSKQDIKLNNNDIQY